MTWLTKRTDSAVPNPRRLQARAQASKGKPARSLDSPAAVSSIYPESLASLCVHRLRAELDAAVESCVCTVGVDVNTASAALLSRVPGLSAARAAAIVTAKPYACREVLRKVRHGVDGREAWRMRLPIRICFLSSAAHELFEYFSRPASRMLQPRIRRNRLCGLQVKGIGPKSYEQAAGFLRIEDGAEPLDATAVALGRCPLSAPSPS